MPVTARQHFARMRGGAQAQLLLASDGHYYIVKFQNNPQHRRVLANEMLAHVLLRQLDLPTPPAEVVEVPPALVALTPEMCMDHAGRREPCSTGLQFGSQYPGDPSRLSVFDFVPDDLLRGLLNVDCFLGMVAFDKWVSNADCRQAVFYPPPGQAPGERRYLAAMIDHGFAFTAQRWCFRDLPQIGLYPRPWLYDGVTGYDSFEPWLGRIREFAAPALDDAYKRVPPQWYDGDVTALERLLEQLYDRRRLVPELLRAAKSGPRDPFPNWS